MAPTDPPGALTQGAADVSPGPSDATTFEPPRRNFPLLLAQGGSYGLAGKLASTNIVLPFLCAALGGSACTRSSRSCSSWSTSADCMG